MAMTSMLSGPMTAPYLPVPDTPIRMRNGVSKDGVGLMCIEYKSGKVEFKRDFPVNTLTQFNITFRGICAAPGVSVDYDKVGRLEKVTLSANYMRHLSSALLNPKSIARAQFVDETDEEKIARLEKNVEHLQLQLRDIELENRDLKTQIRPLKLQIKHFEDNGYKLDKMLELYKLQEILAEYGVSYDIENKTLTWSM